MELYSLPQRLFMHFCPEVSTNKIYTQYENWPLPGQQWLLQSSELYSQLLTLSSLSDPLCFAFLFAQWHTFNWKVKNKFLSDLLILNQEAMAQLLEYAKCRFDSSQEEKGRCQRCTSFEIYFIFFSTKKKRWITTLIPSLSVEFLKGTRRPNPKRQQEHWSLTCCDS